MGRGQRWGQRHGPVGTAAWTCWAGSPAREVAGWGAGGQRPGREGHMQEPVGSQVRKAGEVFSYHDEFWF